MREVYLNDRFVGFSPRTLWHPTWDDIDDDAYDYLADRALERHCMACGERVWQKKSCACAICGGTIFDDMPSWTRVPDPSRVPMAFGFPYESSTGFRSELPDEDTVSLYEQVRDHHYDQKAPAYDGE